MKQKLINFFKLFIQNIDVITIFLWMLYIPITVLVNYNGMVRYNYTNINIIVSSILAFSYVYKLIKTKFKISKYDIIVFILLILNLLSTIFAIDTEVALHGYHRGNGYFALITYSLIFLNLIRIKDKKKIKFLLITIISIGLINFVYSCLELFTGLEIIHRFYRPYMASSLCMNPNFYGSFMSLLLTFSMGLFIFNKKNQIIYFILSLIFLLGIYFAQSTGPLVGVIIAILFLLIIILIYFRKYVKRYFFIVSILCVIFIGVDKAARAYFDFKDYQIDERYTVVGGLKDIYRFIGKNVFGINFDIEKEPGNGRLAIWKNTITFFQKYPLLGCGTDNFRFAYYQYKYPVVTIEAHNVYLNYAANNGIPSALIFIFALLYILYESIKTKDKNITILAVAYVAYCVQAFFNISVIQVSTYFYAFTALLIASVNIYKSSKKMNLHS